MRSRKLPAVTGALYPSRTMRMVAVLSLGLDERPSRRLQGTQRWAGFIFDRMARSGVHAAHVTMCKPRTVFQHAVSSRKVHQ